MSEERSTPTLAGYALQAAVTVGLFVLFATVFDVEAVSSAGEVIDHSASLADAIGLWPWLLTAGFAAASGRLAACLSVPRVAARLDAPAGIS